MISLLLITASLYAKNLADYAGTYRGVTPIDGNEVGLGEIKVVIDQENVRMRFASGEAVLEDVWPTSYFEESKNGFRAPHGPPEFQFRHGFTNPLFPALSQFGLVVRMDNMADRILLMTPSQLRKVSCGYMLWGFELLKGYPRGGRIPRLANGGKSSR